MGMENSLLGAKYPDCILLPSFTRFLLYKEPSSKLSLFFDFFLSILVLYAP